jgi:hypothetical protein
MIGTGPPVGQLLLTEETAWPKAKASLQWPTRVHEINPIAVVNVVFRRLALTWWPVAAGLS